MAIKIQNLELFNKLGENLNLTKDNKGILRGNLVLGKGSVSSGLIESEQIIVLEKVWNHYQNKFDYISLTDTEENSDESIYFKINENDVNEFFTFTIQYDENDLPTVSKNYENSVNGRFNQFLSNVTKNDIEYTNIQNSSVKDNFITNFNTLNVGFSSDLGGSYIGNLEIYHRVGNTDTLFSIISFFVDVEVEDERFTLMLDNLGSKINNKDYFIFDKSNLKDSEVDYKLLNAKRKELLLEFHNIFPYLGSYKALINIIKFFGYENLTIKEYWKNVKLDTPNFGKYKPVDIKDKISNAKNWKEIENITGEKIWKKTNKFSMVYRINDVNGKFDENGLPQTNNVFDFTLDEILIKLYGLKQKLKDYFLPLNAKIVDIIGEALYFSSYELTNWNNFNKIDSINVNVKPTIEVLPSNYGFIEDLRPLEWVGAKIGNDLDLSGETIKRVIEFTITGVQFGNIITIKDTNTLKEVTQRVEYLETDADVALNIFKKLTKEGLPFSDFYITLNQNKILFIEKFTNDSVLNISAVSGKYTNLLPTLDTTFHLNGDNPVDNYNNAYLSYFYDNNFNVNNLENNENIPVGFPVLIKNTTFDVKWENIDISWNTLDENNRYVNFDSSLDLDFPSVEYNEGEDIKNGLTWDTIGDKDFFEVQWKIWKDKSETPYWEYINKDITRLTKEISVILPYVGKYHVEITLYDYYGSFSKTLKRDFITVEQQNPDFTAWKVKDLVDVKWEDLEDLTWEDFNSTWDLPFLPNPTTDLNYINWMSIDRVEFYQNLIMQDAVYKSKYDVNSYTWKNLGDEVSWDDLNHTYWDMLSPSFTKFIINDINLNSTVTISVNDIHGNLLETMSLNTITDETGIVHYDRYVDFIDKLYNELKVGNYPILNTFVYDIRFQYVDNINSSELTRSIVGVSKDFEKPNRYFFEITNGTISKNNTIINGYGILGDSPSSFDIYTTSTIEGNPLNGKIIVDDIEVNIPITVDTLDALVNHLRNSELNDYWDFNIVKTATRNNGPDYEPYISKYILASKKELNPDEVLDITFENVYGTTVARTIKTNLSWNSLDVIYYQRDIKPYTQVYLNYDISKLPGFKNPIWKIIDSKTGELIFEWKNKYLVYLFVNPGEYDIVLELEDTNGNKKTTRKNGFLKIEK